MKSLLAAAALTLGVAAPALAQTAAEPMRVEMRGADGASHGAVTLTQTPNGVLLDGDLMGLEDGVYGFHFHQTGVCEGDFTSAGGHHNPTNRSHGLEVEGGPHAGDMPNVYVVDGKARFQQFNPMVRFTGGDAALNDADGTALMVHTQADDHTSQPTGDAGGRMACGVVFERG